MPKYQVWVNSDLVGHIIGENVDLEDAIEYAIDWRGEIEPTDVSLNEISESYYQELAQSAAW